MFKQEKAALLAGLLAAAAIFAVSTLWVIAGRGGHLSAWAVIPFFWSAVLLAGVAHALRQLPGTLTGYRRHHRPLAGPREGAQLPQ